MGKKPLFLHWTCFTIILAVMSSCSWGKRATPLDLPCTALESAKETSSNLLVESETWIPDEWWLLFNDAQLTQFVQTALEQNPTLQAAQAKILLAIANADRARSSLFPYLFGSADDSTQKISKTGVIPFGTASVPNPVSSLIPVYFNLAEIQLNLRYDFDIWGKNRNTLRAALGEVQANIADKAFAQLQLGISVAQVYYQLQMDYKLRQLAQEQVSNREQYLCLIQKRVEGSLDDATTLLTAESRLAAARQSLLEIEGEIAICEDQLRTYLAGDFEEAICTIDIVDQPFPQVPLPNTLPLHLIAHRPDIIAQLWLIGSAGRQIEVAKAGFYPDFNIAALIGFQTIHWNQLFLWPSVYYNIDPAVSLPIFDGGRLLANLHGSEMKYDLAIFQYNHLILNAVKEVLDGISTLTTTEQQLKQYEDMLNYQKKIFQLTSLRVTCSLDSELTYLDRQAELLNVNSQEVQAFGSTLQAILALIKALGGGYDICAS